MRKLPQTLASILAVAALGSGCTRPEVTGPLNSSTVVTAAITGVAWLPTTLTATYASGTLTIDGTDTPVVTVPPTTPRELVLTIPNVTAVGRYTFGLSAITPGAGEGKVVAGTKIWTTANTGGTGLVNITVIASNYIVGNFLFTAPPTAAGGATGTQGVTSGVFTIYF